MAAAFYILPRFGRKPMLILGGAGQLTMMVLFTILSSESREGSSADGRPGRKSHHYHKLGSGGDAFCISTDQRVYLAL